LPADGNAVIHAQHERHSRAETEFYRKHAFDDGSRGYSVETPDEVAWYRAMYGNLSKLEFARAINKQLSPVQIERRTLENTANIEFFLRPRDFLD
jgi:hypothetical protein